MNKLLPVSVAVVPGLVCCLPTAHRPLTPTTVGLFLLALLLAVRLPVAAQAPAWQSAQAVAVATTVATSNNSHVTATAVDAAGNVYLIGNFKNAARRRPGPALSGGVALSTVLQNGDLEPQSLIVH